MGVLSTALIAGAIAAAGAGISYLGSDADVDSYDKDVFKQKVLQGIGKNSPIYDYVKHQLTSDQLYTIAKQNGLIDVSSKIGTWGGDTLDGHEDVIDLLNQLSDISSNLEYPEYVYLSDIEDDVMREIEAEDARQTELFENQLQENQMMFDDYRSQILQNQYQQNAQLMGSVDSAMSKARRNALEAGASAGLRMAENINTTLALQNKQAQTSLETSNQLAQQLLNQRQASAGIRSNYSDMLASKSDRYYNRLNNAWGVQQQKNEESMNKYLDNFDDMNAFSDNYSQYLKKQHQTKLNNANSSLTNKTSSQYGN